MLTKKTLGWYWLKLAGGKKNAKKLIGERGGQGRTTAVWRSG
jgi:hypothetical protein